MMPSLMAASFVLALVAGVAPGEYELTGDVDVEVTLGKMTRKVTAGEKGVSPAPGAGSTGPEGRSAEKVPDTFFSVRIRTEP